MKLMNAKKGFAISEVPAIAVTLGIVAIVLGIVATILSQVQATQTSGGYAYNITGRGLSAVDSFSQWQGTWAVIIAAAVVIGIIGMYLFFKPRD